MQIIHKELASGKWFTIPLTEQLANIGSEVYRSINWFRKHDSERFLKAFERALELFDLTLEDERWKNRRKEICRNRELFCSLLVEPEKYNNHDTELEAMNKYFLDFGIAYRIQRERNNLVIPH